MLINDNGLDLDFKETKRALNIPVKGYIKSLRRYQPADNMFENIKKSLENIDFQQYITRFKWNNLPEGLDSELFEKIMYFSGSAMFFYIKELNKFYFLPYGMTGEGTDIGIDFYGRFNKIKPYSFNGATEASSDEKKKNTMADIFLSTQIRENIKDIPMVDSLEEAREIYEKGAVICWDITPKLAYFANSRAETSKGYIDYLLKVLTQTKSALINSSGYNMFTTDTEAGAELMQMQIDQINRDREKGALAGVVSRELGVVENLQSNAPNAMADFWSSLQSVDNLRLKSLGISNDGVQQKSQYQNIQEQSIDINDAMQVYWNSFMERIKFSAIVNSIWGLDIYPEPLLLPNQKETQEAETIEGEGESQQAQEGTHES